MAPELNASKLKKVFKIEELVWDDTEKIKLDGIIGQDRAITSLKFGLQIKGSGFNIYVAGQPGIGKMTSVKSFLKEIADKKDTPPDLCFVNNFNDPYNPKAISLPAGQGCKLSNDMDDLADVVKNELPKAFESDEYSAQKETILKDIKSESNKISNEINKMASEKGFSLQSTPMGIMIVPMKEGKTLSEEEFQSLSEEEKKDIKERRQNVQDEMNSAMKKLRKIDRQAQEKVKELDKKVALNIIGGIIEDYKEKYENEQVTKFLDGVQEDVLENIEVFKDKKEATGNNLPGMPGKGQEQAIQETNLKKYKVNVVVDNSKQDGAPVVEELNPTFNNIIGRIEKEMRMGALSTDFTMIKAGSLLRANGGFLVIPVEDILRNYYSYQAIKRALRTGKLQIEELADSLGYMSVKSLKPEPVDLDIKVVFVGSPIYYFLLHKYDEDFPELFKVKADFDTRFDYSEKNIRDLISFVGTYCEKNNVKHLNKKAMVKLLEYSARVAEDQEKLSLNFGHLTDIIRESHYWADKDNSKRIKDIHIKKTLDQKVYRSNLIEERIREMIENGQILIDNEGETIGQVNGLSVLNLGDYMFGKPSRITATVGPGRDGIIDIEREVKLGGPIHSKGVLILSGYLTQKYASGRPLTLATRLVFEQSYEGVEGDSASSTELYAILSALADVPLKQGIAVTGSVNQQGQVQAVGGINQKIEGYFHVCKQTKLNGKQGVIIPKSNIRNLMLDDEIVEQVKKKKFRIWAVDTIDEGIEILTGKSAGKKTKDGQYEKDSINEQIRQKLVAFEETLRDFRNTLGDLSTAVGKSIQK